ncbi:Hydroxymethylglutaryl-CoA synthase [Penicillium canariense]|uniref:Hydroxymethylglutaryl-CoA synthase n=1 Tax=Penicillium canariense TaxID=189055 RepID=A0A9W9I6B1_9EURO|nr:Hydroxymethylglutaryl-CoA synthase [Penicillium canariense]KAJ5167405.1 Hydroxymethylglutaryl-CoA synthase [Penicillium canariense]
MSFCDDCQDIYLLALTAVSFQTRKYNISPDSIGRLEVGTESMLDKFKSCKSVRMQLAGANNIEGIDTYTFFNTVNWIEFPSLGCAGGNCG